MELIYKAGVGQLVEKAEGKPLIALVSTPDVDTDGDVIVPLATDKGAGWDVSDFNARGGRIFWMHDGWTHPNLAKAKAIPSAEGLLLEVAFDPEDELAVKLDRKYREGYLSEWSVGFRGVKYDDNTTGGRTFYEAKLFEVSAVNQGANPNTRVLQKSLDDLATLERRLAAIEQAIVDKHEISEAKASETLAAIARDLAAVRAAGMR